MRSLRNQFILSHILPFMLVLPIAGLVILYLIEAQVMLVELSENLEERAALIAEAVAQQPESLTDSAAAERFIAEISPLVEGDIYLLNSEGTVIAADSSLVEAPNPALVGAEGPPLTSRVQVSYGLSGPEGEAVAPVIDINEQIIGLVGVRKSIYGVAEVFGTLRRLVLLTIIGGLVLGALVGFLLARRLEQPISRTVSAVSGIASSGQTEAIPVEGPRELRQLAEAVNTLSQKLRTLEEMRRRSFANITHELGRPLGAVLAAVQVVRGDAGQDPAIRAELLAGIHKELTGMEPLLDDLSQLHADATGGRRLDTQVVSASEWLATTLPPWREAANDRGLAWHTDIPKDLPEIDIDVPRMTQVVGNLLSNAIKYTTNGGIDVSVVEGLREITISVSDSGPGIFPEDQARIFEPFYRGTTPERTTEGLGVGLSIAQGLTEAHGGRLSVESAPGHGSVFSIHLPVSS